MGIFGSSQPGQPRYSGEFHNLQLTESVYGTCAPIVIGTCRVHGKLLFYGGFYATAAPNSGKGIFGGKSNEYDYYADSQILLAQGSSTQGCQGLLNVWDQNGKLQNQSSTYTYVIPSGGGSVTPSITPSISADLGVYTTQSYSVTANDYGAGGSQTLTGTQNVRFSPVSSPAGPTEYGFNPSTGTYTFPPAAGGTTVTITFSCVFSLYYFEQTQAAEIPATSPYQVSTDNQAYFYSVQSVTYVDTGLPCTSYSQSDGVFTFSSADAGRYVYIAYTYTSSDPDVTNSSTLNLTFFGGTKGQAPWSYMQSKYPGSAFGYSAFCYVGANPLALGESATMPSYNYEVIGLCVFGGGILDAHPCDAFKLILTDPLLGVLFPSANLDTWTSCYAYWAANNYFVSMKLDTQQSVSDCLRQVIDVGNVAAVWSGSLLKLIPYGDTTAVGNGYTYTPPTTPVFTLTWDDILPFSEHDAGQSTSDDPIQWAVKGFQDRSNYVQAQWTNRTNDYNVELTPEQNDAYINQFTFRPESPQTWDFLTTEEAAVWALNLRLKRNCYIGNTCKFNLSFRFSKLEQMDLVVLPSGESVRILQIQDDPNGRRTIDAEQWTYGSADVTLYAKQQPTSFQPNISQALPGNAVPVFIQNTLMQASGAENVVQIAASGQNENWGGCNVLVSTDGADYTQIGVIKEPSVIGILTSPLLDGVDPDTSDTLSVDISFSTGANPSAELVTVTRAQADNLVTLCAIIDQSGLTNELVSYETASLTAQSRYNLAYLRRGLYGSPIAAHSPGSYFAFLGPGYQFLQYQYTPQYIGQSLYVKLQSFNLLDQQLQDASQCKAWQLFVTNQGSSYQPAYKPSASAPVAFGNGIGGNVATYSNAPAAYDGNLTSPTFIQTSVPTTETTQNAEVEIVYSGFGTGTTAIDHTIYVLYSVALDVTEMVNFGIFCYGSSGTGHLCNYQSATTQPPATQITSSATIPAGTDLSTVTITVSATTQPNPTGGNIGSIKAYIYEIWID